MPENPDLGPDVDLTPRSVTTGPARRLNSAGAVALLALAAALGWVLWNGLSGAQVFFLNVDEAVERRDDMLDDRLRVQGVVVDDSVLATEFGADFRLAFNGAEVAVSHTGEMAELFGSGEPVVVEGGWEGETFNSDRMLIKHGNEYEEDNPERLDYDADDPPTQ